MRILHTSDWHLGISLYGVAREADHERFLTWLLETIEARDIDVLIVAGDVFDHAQPSAEAQALYYRFLAKAAGTRLAAVIVIGGNHDSASRLDAPRQLLGALNVHVVGGIHPTEERWADCLIPIDGAAGEVALVVAAVPYIHEYRLGVRATSGDAAAIALDLRQSLARIYSHLADLAEARWPGVPLVATGHLTCVGSQPDDYGSHIHQVATIGALPASVFDERYAYVALGHIHRCFQIEERPIWYSGSPIPMSLHEAQTPRKVLEVDIAPADGAAVAALEVPCFRELVLLGGRQDEIAAALDTLSSEAPLPALVYARVDVEGYEPGVLGNLERALDARADDPESRPRLVNIRQIQLTAEGDDENDSAVDGPAPVVQLLDLQPEQVFRQVCEARDEPVDSQLLTAFRSLLSEDEAATSGAGEEVRQGILLLGAPRGANLVEG